MGLMFHVDESADSWHHFHVGLLVDAREAAKLSVALDEIVSDAYDAGLCRWQSEIHAMEIIGGKSEWRGDLGLRIDVLRQTLLLLGKHDIEVIAHGANLASMRKRYGATFDPYRWEFRNLLERLNERLLSRDEYAVVIADDHASHRESLQRDVIECRTSGTGGYRNQLLTRIVDTAHFVDSRMSRLTQLADVVAYVLRRHASYRPEKDARAEAASTEFHQLVHNAVPDPKPKYCIVRY